MAGHVLKRVNAILLLCMLVAAVASFAGPEKTQAQDTAEMKVTTQGGFAGLASKALNRGRVRIIVGVSGKFTPESALPQFEAQAQRAAISGAQDYVISELAAKGLSPASAYRYKYIPYLAMTVNSATLEALVASPSILSIEEDIAVPASDTESWNMQKIGASDLHSVGITGTGMTVAVLDTGVNSSHPYLSGAVVSEACYSSNDSDYDATSICPGGLTDSTATGSALPYAGSCPAGDCDHGTHVTGIAAGRDGVAGSPGPGVAPGANIIAIQVFSRFDSADWCYPSSSCVMSFFSDQIKGLERVYELSGNYTIASANMSLGGGQYYSSVACDTANKSIKSAIDTLRKAGIATVISSGNDGDCGSMEAPGCISSAISVGATDSADEVASYSNSASFLKLLAPGGLPPPGVGITSSVPGGGYAIWSGTSMAAPHVSGSWALAKQRRPTASVTDILKSFTSTGQNVTDSSKCPKVTKKRINVYQAYNYPPPAISVSPASLNFGSVKLGVPSTAKTITIKNTGPDGCPDLNVSSITADPAEFTFTPASCPSLARGEICALSVQITPVSTYGLRTGSLIIASDASNKSSVTVKLSGNAVPPEISTPSALNFPSVTAGVSLRETITVKNIGLSDLVIGSISETGAQFAEGTDTTTCLDGTHVVKGASCLVEVIFTPAAAKTTYTGSVSIPSNDPKKSTAAVSLKGTGK